MEIYFFEIKEENQSSNQRLFDLMIGFYNCGYNDKKRSDI